MNFIFSLQIYTEVMFLISAMLCFKNAYRAFSHALLNSILATTLESRYNQTLFHRLANTNSEDKHKFKVTGPNFSPGFWI